MAISYPLSLPTLPGFTAIRLYQKSSVAVSSSVFTGQSFIQEHQGQMWGAEITLPPLDRAGAEPWLVWLLQLNGMAKTFLLGDPLAETPQGNWLGSAKVNEAGQSGNSLSVTGLLPGATIIGGDYFQSGQRLYKVITSGTTVADGIGNAVLDIFPSLRESPASGQQLITVGAKGLFRLDSNSNNLYNLDELEYYAMSFSAVEAY